MNLVSSATHRSRHGSIAFELTVGTTVSMTVIAAVLNLCFLVMSYTNNDHACRDAARAVSTTSGVVQARGAARAAIAGFNSRNPQLTPVELVDVQVQRGQTEGDLDMVKVTARTMATLPVPIEPFAKTVPLVRTYAYPIVQQ
jgi:hypothetical protein